MSPTRRDIIKAVAAAPIVAAIPLETKAAQKDTYPLEWLGVGGVKNGKGELLWAGFSLHSDGTVSINDARQVPRITLKNPTVAEMRAALITVGSMSIEEVEKGTA